MKILGCGLFSSILRYRSGGIPPPAAETRRHSEYYATRGNETIFALSRS